MKTIKTYQCECGEDFYEDDVNCLNCRKPIDKSKLKDEEVADIKYSKYEKLRRGYEEVQMVNSSDEIKNYGTGAIIDTPDERDFKYEMPFGVAPLPESYKIIIDKIENQDGSGSCVGQGWAKYLEVLEKIDNGNFTDLSAKSIYSQIFLPQGGAQIRDGAKLAVNFGVNREVTVPSYNAGNPPTEDFMRDKNWLNPDTQKEAQNYESKEYHSIEHNGNLNIIKQAIFDNNGVVSGFVVSYAGWATGDVRPPKDGEATSGHCVYLIGWEGDKILFANSWGVNWGYAGIGKVDPAYWSNPVNTFSLWTLVDKKNTMLKLIKEANRDEVFVVINGFNYYLGNPETMDNFTKEGLVEGFGHEEIVSEPIKINGIIK